MKDLLDNELLNSGASDNLEASLRYLEGGDIQQGLFICLGQFLSLFVQRPDGEEKLQLSKM